LAVGTRLQDFTTGSRSLFRNPGCRIIALNVGVFDATKHLAQPLVADARAGLEALNGALGEWRPPAEWSSRALSERTSWLSIAGAYTVPVNAGLPSDAQVIGAVQRTAEPSDVLVCAA